MRIAHHASRAVAVLAAGTLLAVGLTAPATAASAGTGATNPATPQTATSDPASEVPDTSEPRRTEDEALRITSEYLPDTAVFTLTGPPSAEYDVALMGQGEVAPGTPGLSVTTDASGVAEVAVPLLVGDEPSGAVSLTATRQDDGTTASRSASLWLAPTDDGLVSGGTSIAAQANAIEADNATASTRDAALDELFVAPASAVTESVAAAASGDAVLRGRVRWTDWNGGVHPARHITVEVTEPFFGVTTTTTDDDGNYEVHFDHAVTDTLVVDFVASSDAGHVGFDPGFWSGFRDYEQSVRVDAGIGAGSSRTVNLTIGHNGVDETAFAIHDALWSAYLYGEQAGGDVPAVRVEYPIDEDSRAYQNDDGLHLGEWEWSAWDVVNHEYGHWFDNHHDLTALPGGKHCFGDNLASAVCRDEPGLGKDTGGQLALSEGYGDYFAISAGKYAAHPMISGVGNGSYDDVKRTSTGAVASDADGNDPSFSSFLDGTSGRGEDNESAVAAVLFNLQRDGDSGFAYQDSVALGPLRITQLLEASDAERLSDFLQTARARLTKSQSNELGCLQAAAEIAPYNVTVPAADVSHPPTVTWSAGNKGSFANDRFTVEFSEGPSAEPFFTSATVTGTSWSPTGRQWQDIALGHGSIVYVRIVGTQSDGPATGPFWGCATAYTFASSALVTAEGCTAVTLPANDDGSSGAVDLPFPVNYFGTTYTYLYVNNNGNVTFRSPMSTYTPFQITASTPPIIAPFLADIDTRGSGSAPVTYSYGTTTFNGRQAFCVNWINVGYFSSHYDKLSSAQLLLVDRSDLGAGDFDIVFNYGSVQWETGDASGGTGGFGGTPVAAGYSAGTGDAQAFFQLPGSLDSRALTDGGAHALVSHSNVGLATPGRYVFPVRNGDAGSSSTGVVGEVTSVGRIAAGAPVQVCPHDGGRCVFQTRSGSDGSFAALGIPAGTYDVTAYPPAGVSGRARTMQVTVPDGEQVDVTIELSTLVPVPNGVTVSPVVGSGDMPMLNWREEVTVSFTGCPDGSGTFEVVGESGTVLASGPVRGVGTARFEATIPALYPHLGSAQVRITLECASGATRDIVFDVYIDPSGRVIDEAGRPVEGATVTLERSDDPEGEFTVVPDGSDLMSPANRSNPMTTGADGRYGWDVVAGFYRLTAQKDGCTDPSGEPLATSAVLTIPPPVTDLDLVLHCGGTDTTPPVVTTVPAHLEGNTPGGWSGVLPGVTAQDETAGDVTLVSDAPVVLPLGTTTVTWTATDAAGNATSATQEVTIIDTTAPVLTCPADVTAVFTPVPDLGTGVGTDVVDSAPVVRNDAPATFALGRTTVTWTAVDGSGNTATCAQQVDLRLAVTTAVAAGDSHTLSLQEDGTVQTWGGGGNGQLGTGGTTSSSTPVTVPGLTDVRAVAAGGMFSLALRADGSVWAWGDNSQGQLGDGTTRARTTPAQISGLPPVTAIAAGRFHSLAVAVDGSVWAWGDNTFGQAGSTSTARVVAPAQVEGTTQVVAVAGGLYHSVALRHDGTVLTWGAGYSGQLGDGQRTNSRANAQVVPGLSDVVTIAAAGVHTLVVDSAGDVLGWGDNYAGQLGDGTSTQRPTPVRTGVTGAAAVAAGSDFSVILLRDGTVWATGSNARGQLGDGTATNRLQAVRVAGVTGADAVAAGAMHSAASGGVVAAWGENSSGQIGDGTLVNRTSAVLATGITTAARPG